MSDEQITNRVFFTMLALFAIVMVGMFYALAQLTV